MRHLLFQICALVTATLLSSSVLAARFNCVGTDPSGKTINLMYDDNAATITVNGKLLRIQASTNARNGVATEDYELENGKKAYVSLVSEDKHRIMVRQMDSKSDDELSKVELACN